MTLVDVNDLSKVYRERGADATVLDGASLKLERGETVSLVGTSGAGKSTLLNILAGLLLPDRGRVTFDGQDFTAMDEAGRAGLRARRIGIVLQNDNLIPFLTAAENVELAVTLADGDRPAARAKEALDAVGLASRADALPRRLSGGEAQRAALAVALVNEPDLLLADEVTAELDSATAEKVLAIVMDASRDRGLTVLMVTHSAELARRAGRTLQVADGRVVAA